jgi:outer membrane immunogenic protein
MKKFLLSGVALAILAGPVFAADLPARRGVPMKAPEPVMTYGTNWTGFYVGAHAGGGWSSKCFEFAGASEGCHNGDGWLAGGQLGYNWQAGNWVFGLEFSGSFADISGSHAALLDPTDTYRSRVDSVLLFTGRVGMTFDRVLRYVTGGGAWVNDRFRYVDAGVGTAAANTDRWGWTIGGGAEFALSPNWSLAAQYNYVDLGRRDEAFSGGGVVAFTDRVQQELHLATVRLNYRFGGPVVARY